MIDRDRIPPGIGRPNVASMLQARGTSTALSATIAVILLIAIPGSGDAEVETGILQVDAFDSYTGLPIIDCSTISLPGDTEPVDTSSGLPTGIYDVRVADCEGLYEPQLFTDIEVVPYIPRPITELERTRIDAYLDLGNEGAMVAGQVVDSFSGYPIEGIAAQLIDPNTGEIIRRYCTTELGLYHHQVEPGEPIKIRFADDSICSQYRRFYKNEWWPEAASVDDGQVLTPTAGIHTVAHAALDVDGGFVGRIVGRSGEVPGDNYSLWARQGATEQKGIVRGDGSFVVALTGPSVNIRVKGTESGLLTFSDDTDEPAAWNVSPGDIVNLGTFSLEREATVAGRIVDQFGHPVDQAVVHFFAEGEHGQRSTLQAITDIGGWYTTDVALDGRYTAMVTFDDVNGTDGAHLDVNGTWLGNTADRAAARYVDFDGSSHGSIDFVVNRGESITESFLTIEGAVPVGLTTDKERDGATLLEPLEVEATIHSPSRVSLGTFYDPTAQHLGFTSAGFSATVIYDPAPGSTPLELDAVFEPGHLTQPFADLDVVWNGRLLRSCSAFAPPCEKGRSADERDDLVVSMLIPSGGEAGFVWGPSFLDTGVSIFMTDIEWLADQGVTKGCSPPINDLFCPNDQVTRGQMAAFLVRFLGLTDRDEATFTDDDGSVFEADIEKLATAGITRGCNPPVNDRFCPNDPVTREQMAAFLTRALNLGPADGISFTDDDGSIFEDAIERLAAAGITRGCNPPVNDEFCPNATVTREQMAAFLHRADPLRP